MRHSACLAALFSAAFLASSPTSHAEVILRIDISAPSRVTFTATGAFAQNDDFDTYLNSGFTLISFFSVEPGDLQAFFETPSDLYSPGGNFAYTEVLNMSFTNFMGPYTDLNVFGSGFSTQDFSTSEAALYGSAEIDLSPWISLLTLGTGDIYAGDGGFGSGPLIGQYEVVPEPAALPLAAAGAAMAWLHFTRRKRKAQTDLHRWRDHCGSAASSC